MRRLERPFGDLQAISLSKGECGRERRVRRDAACCARWRCARTLTRMQERLDCTKMRHQIQQTRRRGIPAQHRRSGVRARASTAPAMAMLLRGKLDNKLHNSTRNDGGDKSNVLRNGGRFQQLRKQTRTHLT